LSKPPEFIIRLANENKVRREIKLMEKLLTQQDLADRWQVSVRAIENWRKDGTLQPAKGVPAIRFTPEYIAELEGAGMKKASPLQMKRLEREIEGVRRENEKLKGIMTRILSEITGAILPGENNEKEAAD
jgi:hypothetical protein